MCKFSENRLKKIVILNLIQNLKKILLFILLLSLFCPVKVMAYDLDTSVNNEIEQKYDSDKLNKDMGIDTNSAQTSKKSSKKAPKSTPSFDNSKPSVSGKVAKSSTGYTNTGTRIPFGTKFKVKSTTAVSGNTSVNSILSFNTVSAVSVNGITFPAGTVFKGKVASSHGAQITGNGGLIEIDITSVVYNGKTINIEGKITKANSKNVFLNKIKGKRQYISAVTNQVKKGVNIYNKARSISAALPNNPLGKIAYPIPPVVGAVGTVANTVLSPVVAVFKKGQNISLPAGTIFEIKLTKDMYVN